MFLVLGFEVPAEWGLVGFLAAAAMLGLLWMMRSQAKAVERAERRKDHTEDQFVEYMKETVGAQTEALIAATNTMQRHDEQALQRHEAITANLRGIQDALATVCRHENGRSPK